MATLPIDARPAPVIMPSIAGILARLDRPKVEAFIAVAIDLLDALDGDADAEPNGDEGDGSFAEDEPAARFRLRKKGPGCSISDPDQAADDIHCDGLGEDLEPEFDAFPSYGVDQTCDPEILSPGADYRVMKPHRDRIRRTRCDRNRYGEYRLRSSGVPANTGA